MSRLDKRDSEVISIITLSAREMRLSRETNPREIKAYMRELSSRGHPASRRPLTESTGKRFVCELTAGGTPPREAREFFQGGSQVISLKRSEKDGVRIASGGTPPREAREFFQGPSQVISLKRSEKDGVRIASGGTPPREAREFFQGGSQAVSLKHGKTLFAGHPPKSWLSVGARLVQSGHGLDSGSIPPGQRNPLPVLQQ